MAMDISNFYLNNDLPRVKYIRFPRKTIPDEFMDHYDLHDKVIDGYIYAAVYKGMYGLPQAGRVANDALLPRLSAAGYIQAEHTPGLFKHTTNTVTFCLTVDDFGVKYVNKQG